MCDQRPAGNQPPQSAEPEANSIGPLAEQFAARLRRGEDPSVSEYVDRFPNLADEIREVFPTLALLEGCGAEESRGDGQAVDGGSERLPDRLGEYRVLREVGRGGMGVVYEAEHHTMRRRVALKVLPPGAVSSATSLQRFHREARAAGGLHHTNIVPVFEVGTDGGYHYYAMQFIQGQSLDVVFEELRRLQGADAKPADAALGISPPAIKLEAVQRSVAQSLMTGPLDESTDKTTPYGVNDRTPEHSDSDAARETDAVVDASSNRHDAPSDGSDILSSNLTESVDSREDYFRRVARIGLQVADALSYAHHHGVLHRDIKPANIILDTTGVAWVTDFGLAKHHDDDLTRTGDIVGTFRYMAPERFSGHADATSDVYGLGLTLYELCTLQAAFAQTDRARLIHRITHEGPPRPRKLNPAIPRDLETIVLKAIDRQARHRYATAGKLAEDLRLFVGDRPIRSRRASIWERTWRWCRRNPQQAMLAACVAVLLGVVFIGSLMYTYRARRDAGLLAIENERALGAEVDARQAAERAKENERLANRRLYQQLRAQIKTAPSTHRSGRRFEALAAVTQALRLLDELPLSEKERAEHRFSLRNDAIAVLSLFDVRQIGLRQAVAPRTTSVAFNSSHEIFCQSDESGNIEIHRFADDRLISRLPGPGGRAWRLGFSPDDRYLAATYYGAPPTVYVWDVEAGKTVLELAGGVTKQRTSFRRDGRHIAVGFNDRWVRVYSLPDGQVAYERRWEDIPAALRYSPSGDQLAVAFRTDLRVSVWDLDDDDTRQFETTQRSIDIAWSVTGLLAAGCADGTIQFWNVNDETAKPAILKAHKTLVAQLDFTPDGRLLASDSADRTVRFWNMADREELLRVDGAYVCESGFDADGRRIGYSTESREFGVWELARQPPWDAIKNHDVPGPRIDVQFRPGDGRLFAVACDAGVEIWDVMTRQMAARLPGGRTSGAVFTPDGSSLVTSGDDGLRLWPTRTSDDQQRLVIGPPKTLQLGRTWRATLDGKGTRAAVLRGSRTVDLIPLGESEQKDSIGDHRQATHAVLSPDGRHLVTTTWMGTGIRIWDTQSGELVRDLDSGSGSATPTFSADGRLLATSSESEISLWEVGSWRRTDRFKRQITDTSCDPVAFAPDGRMLAAPFSRRLVQLIDPASRRILAVLSSPRRTSVNIAGCFSPDSNTLAYAVDDEVHFWDLRRLREQLSEIGLDWEQPSLPPAETSSDVLPLEVEVVLSSDASE